MTLSFNFQFPTIPSPTSRRPQPPWAPQQLRYVERAVNRKPGSQPKAS